MAANTYSQTGPTLFPLQGAVQNYAWGRIGSSAKVAQMNSHFEPIVESKPYAELWFGTHANGEANIVIPVSSEKVPLTQFLSTHLPEYRSGLPFLTKVLSIRKALSIQAHPDAELAEKLHASFPDIYKDPNHKPEIVIALTGVEALCGFRDVRSIVTFVESIPEFSTVIGPSACSEYLEAARNFQTPNESPYNLDDRMKSALKNLFSSLMHADKILVREQLLKLYNRCPRSAAECDSCASWWYYLCQLVHRLHDQCPGDVGIFCIFLFNTITLNPGQALFLAPNEPHAYLSGEAVECMATSDNVVRAGLTPKFMDVDTLIPMLTYRCGRPHIIPSQLVDGKATYSPPVSEFFVTRYESGAGKIEIPSYRHPSFVLFTKGGGSISNNTQNRYDAKLGSAYFVFPNTPLTIEVPEETECFWTSTPDVVV